MTSQPWMTSPISLCALLFWDIKLSLATFLCTHGTLLIGNQFHASQIRKFKIIQLLLKFHIYENFTFISLCTSIFWVIKLDPITILCTQ